MPQRLTDQTIHIPERQKWLSALACFSTFSAHETEILAFLLYEVRYEPGETIVLQDALVDSVFILVQGEAEVTRQFATKQRLRKKLKITHVPVAILHPGEAIGLNDTGFFSTTGTRTATVTAHTTVTALCLDLKQLHEFFQQHPHLHSAMYASTEKMLRMHLIKLSLPFSRLSYERLEWLMNKIEEITVPAGSIIFRQGEEGDRCYLIRTGQVEVVAHEPGEPDHELGILKPPTLFGEATLITRSQRNATVRAIEDCQLLVLKHEYLSELIESETAVADMFMTLMVDRSRPIQNPAISSHPRTTEIGQEIVILKNPANGKYFKLASEGWFVWQQLNGKQTMQEITLALAEQYNIFEPDMVAALISKLAKGGFVANLEVSEASGTAKPLWVRAMLRARRILEARVAIKNADKWIDKIYNKAAYLLFTRLGKFILILLASGGLLAFIFSTQHVLSLFKTVHASGWLFIVLLPFTVISVAIHELGHAFATKAFGYEVQYMGVGWYWLGPVAFTDTSDMWLGTRWPRTVVNLAGVFADSLTAGVSALLLLVIANPYVQCFLWISALYTYINAFRMLSPLQDMDGYYVLMDLFDRPRLRHSAVIWLVKELPAALRRPRLFRKNKPEICYWLACIVFLTLVTLLTLWVQGFFLKILNIHALNPLLSLVLPFFIIVISSLGIFADIRSQVED